MTLLEALETELPSWLLNDFEDEETGGGFIGCVFGLIGDVCAHVLTFCCRGVLLRDAGLASDAVQDIAWERGLPRYFAETQAAHVSRLIGAWEAYKYPGEVAIKAQFEAFGFGSNVEIYDADEWPAEYPVGPRSQFWIVVPAGDHPFEPTLWGSFTWGSTIYWGISGCTLEQMAGLRALIRKWKPVQWVCRQVRFEMASGPYATLAVTPP